MYEQANEGDIAEPKTLVEVHFVLDGRKAMALAKMVRRLSKISFCKQIADDPREAEDMQKSADLIQSVLDEAGIPPR